MFSYNYPKLLDLVRPRFQNKKQHYKRKRNTYQNIPMPPPREESNVYIGWIFPNTQFGKVTIVNKIGPDQYQLCCNQAQVNQEFWKDTEITVDTQWVLDQIDVHYYLQNKEDVDESRSFWTTFWKRHLRKFPIGLSIDTVVSQMGIAIPELRTELRTPSGTAYKQLVEEKYIYNRVCGKKI